MLVEFQSVTTLKTSVVENWYLAALDYLAIILTVAVRTLQSYTHVLYIEEYVTINDH